MPLMSGIFGTLSGQYMPASSLGRANIYVTLNKDAFFLSGMDVNLDGSCAITTANNTNFLSGIVAKKWTVDKVVLKFDSFRYGQNYHRQI